MAIVRYERKPLTQEQIARLEKVADLPDDQIDFSDIPESSEADLKQSVRGMFYQPTKKQTTLRLDADILAWFRENTAKGYQTEINRVLRDYVEAQRNKAG